MKTHEEKALSNLEDRGSRHWGENNVGLNTFFYESGRILGTSRDAIIATRSHSNHMRVKVKMTKIAIDIFMILLSSSSIVIVKIYKTYQLITSMFEHANVEIFI